MSGSTSSSIVNGIEAIAIGNFDGMHRGHQALFSRLHEQGAVVVVEHFRSTLTPGIRRAAFTDFPLCFYDFEHIRGIPPEMFVDMLRADFPNLARIVVGEDFAFGAGRSADAERLRAIFEGDVEIVREVRLNGEGIHSRFIREKISEGRIEEANEMLGHCYETWGEVVSGQGIGGEKLVPTLNLDTGRHLLPQKGVYKTETCIDGMCHPSVSFVGHRMTTDGSFAVETHLFDRVIHLERPPSEISIRWIRRIRENRKFASLENLKRQIEKDIEAARER